jgi:hypothetical protein
MTNFTTTIVEIHTLSQVEGKENVVVTALWQVIGECDTHVAISQGKSQFTLLPDALGFTPYENLTEAQVIGWIPEHQIARAQQRVQTQLDTLISPPESPASQPLPWVG